MTRGLLYKNGIIILRSAKFKAQEMKIFVTTWITYLSVIFLTNSGSLKAQMAGTNIKNDIYFVLTLFTGRGFYCVPVQRTKKCKATCIIGASLSEPHTSQTASTAMFMLRRGYTGQLCCCNSATNRTVCHRRYLLHATT